MRVSKTARKQLFLALVLVGVVGGLVALSACAPKSAAGSGGAGTDGEAAPNAGGIAVAWSAQSDCLSCHNSATPGTLGTTHQTLSANCMSCHDEKQLATVHEEHGDSGRTPTKLRYTSVDDSSCLNSSCHSSREELIVRTAAVRVTDSKGLALNPHDLPASETHTTLRCASCHVMHESNTAQTKAESECFGCHHEKVFECGTCHD